MDQPIQTLVTAEDLAAVTDPSPLFGNWVLHLAPERLDDIVAALLQKGTVGTVREALAYLNALIGRKETLSRRVAACDLDGTDSHSALFLKLRGLMGMKPDKEGQDPLRLLGRVGHDFMDWFLQGMPPITHHMLVRRAWVQRDLFRRPVHREGHLFPDYEDSEESTGKSRVIDRRFLRTIHTLWQEVTHSKAEKGFTARNGAKEMRRLLRLLHEGFVPYSEKLRQQRGAGPDLVALSLLSWASAVQLYLKQGSRIFFTEIPALHPCHRLGKWRVDALEVTEIEGRPPTKTENTILREMSRYDFSSLGYLLRDLIKTFGPKIKVTIWDWKFAIGDGGRSEILDSRTTTEARPEHIRQVKRYASLASLDFHFAQTARSGHPWSDSYFTDTRLLYFFPDREPLLQEVSTDEMSRQKTFDEEVVQPFRTGERRALLREVTNGVVGHVINLLSNNGTSRPITRRENQLLLWRGSDAEPGRELARSRRQSVYLPGFHDILEVVGQKDGEERYELHLDRLFEALEDGRVEGRGIGHGIQISCPMPDHEDSTPSFTIYPGSNLFRCFGCSAKGRLALGSVPMSEVTISSPWRRSTVRNRATLSAVVPEDHRYVMQVVQECLRQQFMNSRGEEYLYRTRGIDPDIALAAGVGFGSRNLLEELWNSRLRYEELFRYGFIGHSPKIRLDHPVPRFLREAGLRIEDMTRVFKAKGGREVCGLPYLTLANRVTFPLMTEKWFTNFYGRSTRDGDKRFSHYKLSVSRTGVAQGGFGIDVLDSTEFPFVIVTEAAIDALTLRQAGLPNVMALIGTDNYVILETLERSGKIIWFAFDNDPKKSDGKGCEGQKATAKLMERFRRRGIMTYDFTARYLHVLEGWKDWNKWWTEKGRYLGPKPLTYIADELLAVAA